MDSLVLITLSKFQHVAHILGCEEPLSPSPMTQNLLHEVHASQCWCSLPHSSADSKHSLCLHHYLIHQLWWLLHMLVIEQDDASWAPSSWRLHMMNILSTIPKACRLRDTQQFQHFTCATPMLQKERNIHLFSYGNAHIGK